MASSCSKRLEVVSLKEVSLRSSILFIYFFASLFFLSFFLFFRFLLSQHICLVVVRTGSGGSKALAGFRGYNCQVGTNMVRRT